MALVRDQKFSTFVDGGDLQVDDIVVGLRDGLNTRFNFTGSPPPGVIIPIANGGTGASTAAGARTNLGLAIGSDVEAWSASLDALAALNSTGFVVQTGTHAFVDRTLTGTSNQINISNGSGVAGNPVFTISSTLNLPGTFTIQSSTAVSGIINDNTMATALATNLPTSLAIKTYVDNKVAGAVTSVTGTANQVLVNGTSGSAQTGALTLTLPQSIGTGNSPTFLGLTAGNLNLSANSLISTNTNGNIDFVPNGSGNILAFTSTPFNTISTTSFQSLLPFARARYGVSPPTSTLMGFSSRASGPGFFSASQIGDPSCRVIAYGDDGSSFQEMGLTQWVVISSVSPGIVQSGYQMYCTNASGIRTLAWTATPDEISAPVGIVSSGITNTFTGKFKAYAPTTALGSVSLIAANNAGNFDNLLTHASTSAIRTWTLPDATGTIALTSQIPSGAALTKTDDTNVTLTLGGSPTVALLAATSLTLGWTGTLSASRGGTGVANTGTWTNGGNVAFSGAFTFSGTLTGNTAVNFPTSGTLATTSQLPTPAALTKTDDTNVTLTLGGSPSTSLLQATSLTLGWTGQLGLTRGGTGASLTASNGGIVYSNASTLAILSGTATARQMLQSGASAAPAWSTTTWPATTTINRLLWSSAANVISDLPTANNGILLTDGGGVPSIGNTVGAGLTMPSITFNTTTGIVGTTTNDNAAAGSVGQFVSSVISSASAVSLTTLTAANVTSISLTAGDWDITGNITFILGTGTSVNEVDAWSSSTSATAPDVSLINILSFPAGSVISDSIGLSIPSIRVSISSTTTIYLSCITIFAVSTLKACGGIYARRRR